MFKMQIFRILQLFCSGPFKLNSTWAKTKYLRRWPLTTVWGRMQLTKSRSGILVIILVNIAFVVMKRRMEVRYEYKLYVMSDCGRKTAFTIEQSLSRQLSMSLSYACPYFLVTRLDLSSICICSNCTRVIAQDLTKSSDSRHFTSLDSSHIFWWIFSGVSQFFLTFSRTDLEMR